MAVQKRYYDPDLFQKLANLKLIARAIVEGFISGLHRSPYHGFSVEFAEYRKYVPGDDLKHFDWKAYAKSERHYIKQYQEETNLRAYIVLDSSKSMDFKSDQAKLTKFEYSCYLASALTFLMTRQKDSVGLVTFNDKVRDFVPPKSGPVHFQNIMTVLENTEPEGETIIAKNLHSLAETVKKRGLIIVISDLLEDPGEILRALHHFRHKRHEVLIFHVFDPAELTFPFSQLATFRDMETGDRLQVFPKAYQKEYLDKLEEFIQTYKRECTENLMEYVVVDTTAPYDLFLAAYLSKRATLG
ncbi:MAG: DUF58 domain-containing protein [Planctomycetota bacterium]|jgi:uncharacterized protein (DUF58 family)